MTLEPVRNDVIIFGMLIVILAAVFWTSNSEYRACKWFYKVVPMLLLCYFLPSLLPYFKIADPDFVHKESKLYWFAKTFFLPASLILLTLSIDLKEILKLGPKAIIMFLTGTAGVVLGGPLAVWVVGMYDPTIVGGTEGGAVWRGLSTVAGSWIGGGANQAAMKEAFMSFKDATQQQKADALFPVMVTIDVLVAEFWMVFLLLGVGKADAIDRFFKADSSSIENLKKKMEDFAKRIARVPTTTDFMLILAVAFGFTAISHYAAAEIAPRLGDLKWAKDMSLDSEFLWVVVLATTFGTALSFTPLRNLEGAGASKIGSVFIFILVATIGLKMDVSKIAQYKELFVVGLIWILFHVGLLFFVAWLIRAPYFFLAVGSKANIGGAASAPVVAGAFHPALAPVGVLLAVLGYALGTYGALLCAQLMRLAAPG